MRRHRGRQIRVGNQRVTRLDQKQARLPLHPDKRDRPIVLRVGVRPVGQHQTRLVGIEAGLVGFCLNRQHVLAGPQIHFLLPDILAIPVQFQCPRPARRAFCHDFDREWFAAFRRRRRQHPLQKRLAIRRTSHWKHINRCFVGRRRACRLHEGTGRLVAVTEQHDPPCGIVGEVGKRGGHAPRQIGL